MKGCTTLFALCCAVVILFTAQARGADKELMGAGATFPFPLYQKMFDTYFQTTGIKVNYQAIGSGGGIQQLVNKTVDFGGTDAFMTDEEIAAAGAPIVHIPTCLGAVVLTYNLPGNPSLKLTPDTLVDIFLGKITQWNDKRLVAINPGVVLPDMQIVTVHRSDGSGTTAIFSDYLAKVSEEWKTSVGAGKSLKWPCGLGAKGNPGVAGLVKQVPGSIGYVELIYALGNNMPYADIRNKAGVFVKPTIESVSRAAAVPMPDDTRVSITDTDARDGYPISGFTWIVAFKDQKYGDRSKAQAESLVKLLGWMINEGQKIAQTMNYAPLPDAAVAKAKKIIASITYGGQPVVQ
ncbi:MAG: phosphate ABC transporter substrate-binding protein PstS [Desulfobacterota bacterium]|nr:phosphate ABC transporter substrate-binding protein PstS [Thermodesulfobacteriota bacterium]